MTNAEARFNKSHIRTVYACLAVTCHLHFWQNDQDFLRATVVTWGWNGYRNKSQHRKSTLEKKILPPFQQGFEPATFQSRVRCSNHWAIPAPLTGLSGLPQDVTHELRKICCATCTVVASIVVSLDIVTYNKNYTNVPYFTVNLEKKKKKKIVRAI